MGRREDSSFNAAATTNDANSHIGTNNGAIPAIKHSQHQKVASFNAPQIIGNTTKATKFIQKADKISAINSNSIE
jgi:hypothetical protein